MCAAKQIAGAHAWEIKCKAQTAAAAALSSTVRPSETCSHLSRRPHLKYACRKNRCHLVNKKFMKFHLGAMNIAARVIGCCFLIVGVGLLLTALLGSSDRLITGIFAILGIVIGTACLAVRPVEPADIENFLDGKGQPRRTGTYEKKK